MLSNTEIIYEKCSQGHKDSTFEIKLIFLSNKLPSLSNTIRNSKNIKTKTLHSNLRSVYLLNLQSKGCNAK